MKKSVYQTIISLLILVIVMSVFAVVNIQVSLTYETENMKDCISLISGRNLCQELLVSKIIIVICLIVVSGMLSFRSRIVKD
ncbi:hypothetical protein [Epilithonimonas xixisoli]|uniref:Uncharacterized protein n=1 Tax=Epilithonimonas xixisoli TaxID=1476462 RepID=A0A4R8IDE5_9FLAO|nr:hypothetical protein [Epilithonimonas xixisoli]TDX82785.1 hypothetical protein B0I22_2813 [Epilithonimonas xixisoli]